MTDLYTAIVANDEAITLLPNTRVYASVEPKTWEEFDEAVEWLKALDFPGLREIGVTTAGTPIVTRYSEDWVIGLTIHVPKDDRVPGREHPALARVKQAVEAKPKTPDLMHDYHANGMWEKLVRLDLHGGLKLSDVDGAIQSAIEKMETTYGHRISTDSGRNWSEIEGIVLDRLNINEGLYWAEVTG